MDKVKTFLEAYVQWLAVALGVAFLGWMVWGYVVTKPVSSIVGSASNVSPGDINHLIWEQAGEPLQAKVNDRSAPVAMGPSKDFPGLAETSRDQVPQAVATDLPVPTTPIPLPEDVEQDTQLNQTHSGPKITSLPEVPAVSDLAVSGGHSNVPAPQPVAVNGAPPPPPAQGNGVQAVDRNWRTVGGIVHAADLAKAFAKVGIVAGSKFSSTAVLRVILVREEKKSDGSWGSDTTIDPLDINPLPPLPPVAASFADQKSYLEDFAEKNFLPIARPPFYQVLQGDLWYEPGTLNPNEALMTVDDGYDPKNPGAYAGDLNKLLPSEQKLVTEAKARQAIRDAQRSRGQNNRNNYPNPGLPPGGFSPGGFPPGGPGAGGNPVANDPQRPSNGVQMDPPVVYAPLDPGPNGVQPPGFAGIPFQPGGGPPPPAVEAPLPTGSFDPSQQGDFKIWVHDVSVQAGKTYRYKLKYIVSNPVARTNNLCDPPDLAKQFYIESAFSAWTNPVSVESDTNFYAVDLKHGVLFDVFKWKDGIWQMQEITANIGDMVGSIRTDRTAGVSTDFTTGWTLVDIREDPVNTDNRELVLVSENGTVLVKELATDAHSPEYRRLYLQANDPKNKPAMAGMSAGQNP